MTNTHGPTSDLTQFLSARAIPEVLAEELGVKLIGGAAAAELLGLQSPIIGECIAIPYRGTEYVRVRVLQPDDNGGARYLCPAGMPVPLYVPGATIERAREGQRVIVVESPLKAMAMVAAGFAAVGLGGIGTTLEEGKPNDSWKVYPWTELTVLPDGNARTNPAVARDVARLCAALRCAFGDVRLAQLPADVGDIGPDDFLAQRDADAMKAVLDAAVPADPVARIAAAADRNALLDDACFLAAVEQATHAETASIRDYAKRSFGVRQLNLALGHAKSAARAKAAEGAVVSEVSSGDFGVEDGCLVRYADEGKASVIVHGVIKIVAESVSLDAPDREHYVEIEAWLPDGTSLGQRSIPARDLMAPGVFLREFGSRLRIDAPPYAVLQAIQSASDPRIRFVTSQLGWLHVEGGLAFAVSNRVVGAADVIPRIEGQLARYKLPARSGDLKAATRTALDFLSLAPNTPLGPLCLGLVGTALLAHFVPVDFIAFFAGHTGSRKSTVAAAVLSHFGDFSPQTLPTSFSSSFPANEALMNLAGDVILVIDDYVARHANDPIIASTQKLIQNIGNSAGRAVVGGRDRSIAKDRSPRGVVIATGEHAPEGASVMARTVEFSFRGVALDLDVLTEIQRNQRRLPEVTLAIVAWIARHSPGLTDVLAERLNDFEKLFRQIERPSHTRVHRQLAQLLLGFQVYLEAIVERGVVDDDVAFVLFRDAQLSLLELGLSQATKQREADPVVAFCERLDDLLRTRPDLFPKLGEVTRETSGALGYRDGEYLHLVPSATFNYVRKFLDGYGKQNDLFRTLVEKGIARAPDRDRPYDRKITIPNTRERVRVCSVRVDRLDRVEPDTGRPPGFKAIPFEPLPVGCDEIALADFVFLDEANDAELIEEAGSRDWASANELEAWVSKRDASRSLVVWADGAQPTPFAGVPRVLDLKSAARGRGLHEGSLAAVAAKLKLAERRGALAVRALARHIRADLNSESLQRTNRLESEAMAVFHDMGARGVPIEQDAADRFAVAAGGELGRASSALAAAGFTEDESGDASSMISGLQRIHANEFLVTLDDVESAYPESEPVRAARGVLRAEAAMATAAAISRDVVDGRVRYAVSAETVTGRIKCAPYYLMQLPKEGGLRGLIAAGADSAIVAADIRSFELTVLAALAPLQEVLDELQSGRDAYAFLARHAMDVL